MCESLGETKCAKFIIALIEEIEETQNECILKEFDQLVNTIIGKLIQS